MRDARYVMKAGIPHRGWRIPDLVRIVIAADYLISVVKISNAGRTFLSN
jgi:hypothetical protein